MCFSRFYICDRDEGNWAMLGGNPRHLRRLLLDLPTYGQKGIQHEPDLKPKTHWWMAPGLLCCASVLRDCAKVLGGPKLILAHLMFITSVISTLSAFDIFIMSLKSHS